MGAHLLFLEPHRAELERRSRQGSTQLGEGSIYATFVSDGQTQDIVPVPSMDRVVPAVGGDSGRGPLVLDACERATVEISVLIHQLHQCVEVVIWKPARAGGLRITVAGEPHTQSVHSSSLIGKPQDNISGDVLAAQCRTRCHGMQRACDVTGDVLVAERVVHQHLPRELVRFTVIKRETEAIRKRLILSRAHKLMQVPNKDRAIDVRELNGTSTLPREAVRREKPR